MAELLDMGEYATFLWAGWGVTVLALGGLIAFAVAERGRARARLKQAQDRAGQAQAGQDRAA